MTTRNTIIFLTIFSVFVAGGAAANDYVEQKRLEKFYSRPDLLPLSNDEEFEREVFEPREYVKIKSLSSQ
ncbi:hypothetical protein SAMN05192534_10610 [Alteribacillus persepolensis]|uniref:Uncharacterized protein n=1 Tax=Alteribacillus persepolensis TaxID=568899 RepID=A0A1G8CLX9_9BACI|nr:hypothetical protein [Alteribacillus persepolensis]SDH46561.1 hypothetical protein SAMN05192534_10610 [Alteribacillus persepolensis]